MADTHGHGTRHTAGQRPMNTQLYTNSGVLTDSADSWDRTVQTPGTGQCRLLGPDGADSWDRTVQTPGTGQCRLLGQYTGD